MLPTAVMVLSTPSADRAWRHRTQCAAYTALQSGRGDTSLCAPYARDRPGDSLSLRARAVDPQSRRNVAAILGRPISAETVSQVAKTLYRHGLTGEGLDSGLLAALPIVLHGIPVQRCWAHKIRNILDKVRKADQPKSSAHSTRSHSTRSCMPCRALGRSSVRRSLRGRATPMRLHACATTSTNCSPASATNPRSNVEGTNTQRHRTTLPRSTATY